MPIPVELPSVMAPAGMTNVSVAAQIASKAAKRRRGVARNPIRPRDRTMGSSWTPGMPVRDMDNGKASEAIPTVGHRESFRMVGLRSINQS